MPQAAERPSKCHDQQRNNQFNPNRSPHEAPAEKEGKRRVRVNHVRPILTPCSALRKASALTTSNSRKRHGRSWHTKPRDGWERTPSLPCVPIYTMCSEEGGVALSFHSTSLVSFSFPLSLCLSVSLRAVLCAVPVAGGGGKGLRRCRSSQEGYMGYRTNKKAPGLSPLSPWGTGVVSLWTLLPLGSCGAGARTCNGGRS